MSKFDQAKMVMQARKLQKQLKKEVITVTAGDDAIKVEITGEQKIKKIHIDPEKVDLDNIGETEKHLEEAIRNAITESQKYAAEKMKPFMGLLGDLGQ